MVRWGADSPRLVTALHVRELPGVPDALEVLEALRGHGHPWLLDSALPSATLGRFSFVGADPYAVLRVRGGEARLEVRRPARPELACGTELRVGDALDCVRALLPPPPGSVQGAARCPVPFVGGAVGYFGYELGEQTQGIRLQAPDDLGLPDLALLFCDRVVAIDHLEARAWVSGLGFAAAAPEASARAAAASGWLAERVSSLPPALRPGTRGAPAASPWVPAEPPGLTDGFDEERYAQAVRETLAEIEAGRVYQANLTHRMELPLPGADRLRLYRELRDLNPAPFGAYLELPEVTILSSSPERFLRLDGERRVESRPIKGTRPRGATLEADRRLEQELRASEKDRAENLMIVDLVRNDLGRVCEIGSVVVPELMTVERYATVHQMVSSVTGRLRADCDACELVRATFPPGSMTGAPKLAAMRWIDHVEPIRRGVYSGGLGYLDVRGGLDLSVVIRTLLVARDRALLHVGGGIVADSDPRAEWRESLDKARALLAALCRLEREPASPGSREATSWDAAARHGR